MWKELSRGFKFIESEKENYKLVYGNEPISELAGQFPLGLNPSDIEKSGHHGATFYEHIEFIKKLNGDSSNSATVLEGLWSVIIASAAQKSIETGNQINMDDFLEKHNLSWIVS